MNVANALQGVLTLLLVIALGYVMAKRGAVSEQTEQVLSHITIRYAIPLMLFDNALRNITPEFLADTGIWLLLPTVAVTVFFVLGHLLARLFRLPEQNRGVFVVMFSLANAVFIGLPVNLAIFGEAATPYVMAYYLTNTVFFWTVGIMGMARDAGTKFKMDLRAVKQVFSPPMLGFLLGTAAAFLRLQLPDFLMKAVQYVGGIAVPLSLLVTGSILARMGKEALKVTKEGWLVLLSRLLLMPAFMLSLCLLMEVPPLMTGVFTVESAMPVMSQCVIMARSYKANYALAAQMLTLTTLACLVFVPVLVWVMSLVLG